MLVNFISLFVLLSSISSLAMDDKSNDRQSATETDDAAFHVLASQEIKEAFSEQRSISAAILQEWRSKYSDFINNKKPQSPADMAKFLNTYYVEIKTVFKDELATTSPKTQKFLFVYQVFDGKIFRTEKVSRKIAIRLQAAPFTLGRSGINQLNMLINNPQGDETLKKLNTSLSRINLVLIPLGDGRTLIFDPFSLTGSELCSEDEIGPISFASKLKEAKRTHVPLFLPMQKGEKLLLRLNQGLLRIENLGDYE